MKNQRMISGACGILAALFLILFPVLGGGWESLTTPDILKLREIYAPISVKAMLLAGIACGIMLPFMRPPVAAIIVSIAGFVCVCAAYSVMHVTNRMAEMRSGSYLALFGFAIGALINFVKLSKISSAGGHEKIHNS